jgi:hypothetical protein
MVIIMKRIDTLEAYNELIKTGSTPENAAAHVKILVNSQEIDLNVLKTEFRFMNLKLYYIMAIGTAMAGVGVFPKIASWFQ